MRRPEGPTPLIAGAACALLLAAPAHAASSRAWLDARAALTACRGEADVRARGACLERAAEAMDAAEARGEGPLPSPTQARETRKRDYGLRTPLIPPLPRGPRPHEEDRPDRLVTTLRAVRQDGEGNWVMTTAEGAVWAQTDKGYFVRPPHEGSSFYARPGALGSFFCLVDGKREVRCKRRS